MKRIIYILLLFVLPLASFAQERKVQNKPYIDYRRLHYGFFVGAHVQDMEFMNNGFVTATGEQWFADIASYNPGFTVGVLADWRLSTHFSLRALPTLHFGQNTINFREQNSGNKERQQVKTTYLAMPLHVKYSAERFNNYRPYLTAGIAPMMNLTVKKQRPILFKKFDCMFEVGFGCDFYLPFFKLIPGMRHHQYLFTLLAITIIILLVAKIYIFFLTANISSAFCKELFKIER